MWVNKDPYLLKAEEGYYVARNYFPFNARRVSAGYAEENGLRWRGARPVLHWCVSLNEEIRFFRF